MHRTVTLNPNTDLAYRPTTKSDKHVQFIGIGLSSRSIASRGSIPLTQRSVIVPRLDVIAL